MNKANKKDHSYLTTAEIKTSFICENVEQFQKTDSSHWNYGKWYHCVITPNM